ncbi:OB-fold nucleic acid binding domain-containing protein [Hymenobacter bucti]|uniref:OB-fold nucleic acid binding domain-containing protein n=1 Tax=Hymenobacter bucti TaxID=1844114 RepID=A0ABW4QRR4_9BACT
MSHPTMHTVAAALAALLLAGPLAHAQQASSTKTKQSKTSQAAPALATTGTAPTPPPLAGGPKPPRPGDGPGRPNGPGPRPAGVQALSDVSGTLTDYTAANDDQVYDAFTLKTSAGTETVHFPRHLAQALMAAAKAGSQVTVSGFRNTDPEGRAALHLVSLMAGGQTVRDTPPARPTTPPTEEATTVRGTVQRIAQDPKGRTNAVVISDGTVLRLPPDAAAQLAEKLKVGATVAATGALRAPVAGEVAAKPVRVVRAQTITLDGVQFLVR